MNDISQNNLTSIDTQPNFSSKRPEIGSIPIHTMKKDLENINNPGSVEEDGSLDPPHEPKQSFLQTPQSQPRTSPFLSQDTQREVSNIPVPIDERVSDELTPHSPSNWGKLIFVACLIFLLFAVATGGYYYWMNKKNTQKSTENTVITPPKQLLATDKPNYLNVDINADKINLLSATDKYIREIKEENANSPIEFQVVDSQNNPILFKNFAAKIGITLTSEITSNLKDNFSLFIYQDESQPRIGLAIDSNDLIGANLKDTLQKNESGLLTSLSPMYLENSPYADESPFNTSYYGGAEIRYKNINSMPSFSLDYTIFRDKLIISTSKMSLRSIIDYLTVHGKVQGAEDVIDDMPEEMLQNGQFSQ